MKRHKTLEELLDRELADMDEALKVLQYSLEEGGLEHFLESLQAVARAQGGIAKLAHKTGLARQTLYRVLSKDGNPEARSLWSVVEALGLKFSLKTTKAPKDRRHKKGSHLALAA